MLLFSIHALFSGAHTSFKSFLQQERKRFPTPLPGTSLTRINSHKIGMPFPMHFQGTKRPSRLKTKGRFKRRYHAIQTGLPAGVHFGDCQFMESPILL